MKFKQNQGLALPIILILLLVMTILGVTSLSSSTLQERMAASQRLRQVAFNFAETTLREGENHAREIATEITEDLLTTQGGAQFRFFGGTVPGRPSVTDANPGDTCTGGYCTPLEFDNSTTSPAPTLERWLDATVWSNTERHRVLQGFTAADLAEQDIAEAPKYIIEFLGQLPVQETEGDPDSATTECTTLSTAITGTYPYCKRDPYFFRITARAITGVAGRESVVMLQSTIVVD